MVFFRLHLQHSEAAFKALHTKRSPLASFLSFGKSKRKSLRAVPSNITRGHSSPAPSVDEINVGVNEIDTSQLKMTRSTSTTGSRSRADGNDLATDEFRRAREAEMKQDLVVRGLEEKVAEFKRNVGRLLSCRCGFACMVILMIYHDRKRR